MKKLIVAIGVILLASCSSSKDLIQRSDISITTQDEKILYIKNTVTGRTIYETWQSGAYGNATQVYLVNESEFEKMTKKVRNS